MPEYDQLDLVKIVDFYYWLIPGPMIFFASVSKYNEERQLPANFKENVYNLIRNRFTLYFNFPRNFQLFKNVFFKMSMEK